MVGIFQFSTFLAIAFLIINYVDGKNQDKYFLSKCTCEADVIAPDCDFSSLSKKNMKILVNRLMEAKIICVSAENYLIPTFSTSYKDLEISVSGNSQPQVSAPKSSKGSKAANIPAKFNPMDPTSCKMDGLVTMTQGLQFHFPTVIMANELVRDANTKKHNENLKKLILDLEEEDDGCKFNLHGGYRSQDGFLNRSDPSVQWLRGEIVKRVNYLLGMANATNIPFTVDGWAAVLRAGHSQNMHVHPGSMWAGVYYVTAPKEIGLPGKSEGCLTFFDPRPGAQMAQVIRGKGIYGDPFEVCPPTEGGLLVIFPSWLMHEVKTVPFNSKDPRIGISWNAVYNPFGNP